MNDSVLGSEVDGYRIEKILGRGGMGVVYKAEDVALSRDVAIKSIEPSLANDEAFLRRFRSEAQALARVDSPYITSVYALRQTEIGLLIVMEFVEGGTVKDLIEKGPMDWEDALPLIQQMLTALEHAHGAEVIHRDIKPQNIMLEVGGTVKVTDFGLAKVHRPDEAETVTQGVYGTLNYMSPEQVQGSADLDHRSDLYSLGMTIYEMLVGDLPFDEDSGEFTKMRKIVEEDLPPPTEMRPQVPDRASELLMKSLEKDPDDRYQTAQAMREALGTHDQEQSSGQQTVTAPPTEEKTVEREPVEKEPVEKEPVEKEPVSSSESSSNGQWIMVTGVAALVLLVAAGGVLVFAGGLFGGDRSGPPTTRFSVSTDPSGATVTVNNQQIGTSPLSNTTIEGDSAQVRIEKAGFVTRDTVLSRLAGTRQVNLDLSLAREERSLTFQSDPAGAEVLVNGEVLGTAPQRYTTRQGTLQIEMRHEGYVSRQTRLAVAQLDQDEFEMQLERRAQPDRPTGGDNGDDPGGNNTGNTPGGNTTTNNAPEEDPPAYGALTLNASPSRSVSVQVDGERRPAGQSVQVRAGEEHEIHIEHPQRGACDTTLTVQEGATEALTCYFEHPIEVLTRTGPWANVFIDDQNTEASTPHQTTLPTGETYKVEVRSQSRPVEVTGGRYVKRWKVNGESKFTGPKSFSGTSKTITLRPRFYQVRHIVDFKTRSTNP